jgi:hypothetical protein
MGDDWINMVDPDGLMQRRAVDAKGRSVAYRTFRRARRPINPALPSPDERPRRDEESALDHLGGNELRLYSRQQGVTPMPRAGTAMGLAGPVASSSNNNDAADDDDFLMAEAEEEKSERTLTAGEIEAIRRGGSFGGNAEAREITPPPSRSRLLGWLASAANEPPSILMDDAVDGRIMSHAEVRMERSYWPAYVETAVEMADDLGRMGWEYQYRYEIPVDSIVSLLPDIDDLRDRVRQRLPHDMERVYAERQRVAQMNWEYRNDRRVSPGLVPTDDVHYPDYSFLREETAPAVPRSGLALTRAYPPAGAVPNRIDLRNAEFPDRGHRSTGFPPRGDPHGFNN